MKRILTTILALWLALTPASFAEASDSQVAVISCNCGKVRLPTSAEEQVIHGQERLKIAEVIDGDSFKVEYELDGGNHNFDTEIRLIGIDAPEILVPGEEDRNKEKIKKDTALIAYFEGRTPSRQEMENRAQAAKKFLKEFEGKKIQWEYVDKDPKGRPLVYAYVRGRALNPELVANGHAWPYLRPYRDKEHWGKDLDYSEPEQAVKGRWLDVDPARSREILEAGRIKYRKLYERVTSKFSPVTGQLAKPQDQTSQPGRLPLAGYRDGVLLKGSRPAVYIIQGGRRSWIPDPATFKAKGYDWNKIVVIPDEELERIPRGPDVRR